MMLTCSKDQELPHELEIQVPHRHFRGLILNGLFVCLIQQKPKLKTQPYLGSVDEGYSEKQEYLSQSTAKKNTDE